MWLEEPSKAFTAGIIALIVGATVVTVGIQALHWALG